MPIDYPSDAPWPPPAAAAAKPYYDEWLTWWAGDVEKLHDIYTGYSQVHTSRPRPSQYAGGTKGWLSRMWHGMPANGPQRRLHVPAASDVSMISADMLFSDPPKLTLETDQAGVQGAFEDMTRSAMLLPTLTEGAEMGSAAGGVYFRQSINVDISPIPISEAILPDNAIPDWYGPFLRAVTFWVNIDKGRHLRHVERHEMIGKKCVVFHALFEGSTDKLGRRVPLIEGNAECQRLAKLVDAQGAIVTDATRLDVVYVPNVRPHRLLRGTMLGRSDYQGAEGSMDALDETMSSWMRDIRNAKGRVIVPREYTRRAGGPGDGGAWDPEQEIYSAINAQAPGGEAPPALTIVQFAIRTQEHRDTCAAHWRTITSAAGLDTSDHDTENGPQQTATQVNDKGSRKRATRGKKINYWTPALEQIAWVMQELAGAAPARVKVEFPDSSSPDIMTMAQTLQFIAAADAASKQTLVEMLHPDWDKIQVDEEVARIMAAAPPAPTDPTTFNPGGPEPANANQP